MSAQEPQPARRVLAHLGVMAVVAAVMGVVVAGIVIPFAGVLGIGARNASDAIDQLPASLETRQLAQRTTIVDRSGNTIATLYDQNRVEVPLRQVSRTMVKAIVAIEDYRFYQHGALDLRGTLRAFVTNSANSGTVQGGSSITQQLVKQTLVNQARTRKEQAEATANTYARKLRELRYAIALEQRHSKDWILERYLNIAYFGDGAYGIQAAAKHYFDVNARDLSLRQSALLAGLVKNPSGYDPTNNPKRAKARRDVVLDRMAQLKAVSPEMVARTKKQPLGLKVQPSNNGCVFSAAPFFCDYVVNYLMDDRALGRTAKDRKRLLYSGGLTIRTTLDQRFQQAADKAVAAHVNPTDNAIGGVAMVEPGSGQVRALAQSRPMGNDVGKGQTFLNYVVPKKYGDANGFQAGSTFKAFVLASAINQGIPLTTTIPGPQTRTFYQGDFRICDGRRYPSRQNYTVQNSTGAGTYNLYTGTQKSVNTFYIELEKRTGLCEPYTLAKKMGITQLDPASRWMVPTFTLGVNDTSPLEMAEAYATFGARGLHCDARPVTSISDANGNRLKTYGKSCDQVMPQSTADAVNSVLRGVMEPGGFGNKLALDKPSAGKTGTISGNKAVWFMGYTPSLATAAMVAGANRQGTQITLNGQIIGGKGIASAFGSTVAGPIWADAMRAIQDRLPDVNFSVPSANEVKGVVARVPAVGGKSLEEARRLLEDAGFTVTDGGARYTGYPAGTAAFTYPGAGSSVSNSAPITLFSSSGPRPQPTRPSGGSGGSGGNAGAGAGQTTQGGGQATNQGPGGGKPSKPGKPGGGPKKP
ncbi:penicillin-binding protein [Nocardioides sp. TRM66260-LWL]|uniref:penicillin-binding protein n=1 Tax=Nocardioides sp. TRM66260-LWL TaxID=2874478 RepID=UPI001CC5C956|nr:penicillin-binding protein [Nocardioides sp. TRM66260-LWL]MBZ5736317.1 penicillin-binding protein [Nocardioides sp. TRM66260-LWL]